MNTEQIEYELTLLQGKQVYLVVPLNGRATIAYSGELQVTETKEHLVGFHMMTVGAGIIFFADDVMTLEPALTEGFVKTIRLKKNA